jgi:flagellar basal body-associated protein FliL
MIKQIKNEKKKGPNKLLILVLIFLISFAASFGSELMSYKSHQESSVDNGLDTKEMVYTEFIKELENQIVEKATISRSSPTVFSI